MRVFDVEGQPLNLNSSSSAPIEPSYSAPAPTTANGSQRYEKAQAWKPSKTALWLSALGIIIVGILSFGLVFGLPHGTPSSQLGTPDTIPTPTPIPINGDAFDCQQLSTVKFWDVLYPTDYAININLDSNQFNYNASLNDGGLPTTFPASTVITFHVNQPTSCIVLHSDNLTYSEISVQESQDGQNTVLCNDITSCDGVVEQITATPNSTINSNLISINLGNVTLQPGIPAIVSFYYTGSIGSSPSALGLHHSSPFAVCSDPNDQSTCTGKVLVSSQLERTGARRVFPSYDMPSSKAVFTVSVTVPTDEVPVVLSNTDEASKTTNSDGTTTITFEPTPKMSPYLVGITAGDLKQVGTTTTATGVNGQQYEMRGWAVPGREGSMASAQEMSGKALEYYSKYFDMDQPLKKFDLVAIPGRSYAMEDWGLLLMDEGRTLYNTSTASAFNLEQLASVICHEMAHQWLGNLVTNPTWNELVINEGLSSLQEYDCIQAMQPELSKDALRHRLFAPVQNKPSPHDGLLSMVLYFASDPLTPPAVPESDLVLNQTAAERIAYSKGAGAFLLTRTALDMTLSALQPNLWQNVLQTALKNHQYSTLSLNELYATVYQLINEEYQKKVGPGKEIAEYPQAALLMNRAQQFVVANGSLSAIKGMTSTGMPSIASWFYSSGYPLLHPDAQNTVVANNLTQSLLNLSLGQTRFCSWNISDAEAKTYKIPDTSMTKIQDTCNDPSKFAIVLQISNMSTCGAINAAKDPTIPSTFGPLSFGPVMQNGWVPNVDALRMWRAQYSPEHLNTLIDTMDTLIPCEADAQQTAIEKNYLNASVAEQCCSPVGDILKANAVVTDAVVLASIGELDSVTMMRALEKLGTSPITFSGVGQYIALLQVIESLDLIRPYITDNATCTEQFDALTLQIIEPHVAQLMDEVKTPIPPISYEDSSSMSAEQIEQMQSEYLGRLAAAQILRRAAVIPGSDVNAADVLSYMTSNTNGNNSSSTIDTAGVAPAPLPSSSVVQVPATAPALSPTTTTTTTNTTTRKLLQQQSSPSPSSSLFASLFSNTNITDSITSGNTTFQSELCAMLPSTPLWHDYIDNNNNNNNATTTTSGGDTNTTDTITTQRASPSSSPTITSSDLLPTIYSVAAAMPQGCKDAIGNQTLAAQPNALKPDPGYLIRMALLHCWYYDPDISVATTCMYSALNSPTAVLGLMAAAAPTNTTSLTDRLRYVERRKLQEDTAAWTLYLGTRIRPDGWNQLMELLSNSAAWNAISTPGSCGALMLVRGPVNEVERKNLDALLKGNASVCPDDVKTALRGKMLMNEKNDLSVGVCAYLSEKEGSLLKQQQKR